MKYTMADLIRLDGRWLGGVPYVRVRFLPSPNVLKTGGYHMSRNEAEKLAEHFVNRGKKTTPDGHTL